MPAIIPQEIIFDDTNVLVKLFGAYSKLYYAHRAGLKTTSAVKIEKSTGYTAPWAISLYIQNNLFEKQLMNDKKLQPLVKRSFFPVTQAKSAACLSGFAM